MRSDRRTAEGQRPSYDELRAAAAEVGRALARARGLSPDSWFKGLPAYLSVLPVDLLRLFANDEAIWTKVAEHHGMTLEEWRNEDAELFSPMHPRA